MQRRKPLKRKTRLHPVSRVRKTRLREYARRRLEFLREHIFCVVCGEISTEVHHLNGRIGQRLNDFEHCLPVCFMCHRRIHDEPRWARENGYLK